MELDAEIQKFREYLDTPKTKVVNIARQQELMDAYFIIRRLILAEDADATIEIAEDPLQMGSMSIMAITSAVTVYDMDAFADAIKNASNFQVCPTNDDRVKFDVLFEGVIKYALVD